MPCHYHSLFVKTGGSAMSNNTRLSQIHHTYFLRSLSGSGLPDHLPKREAEQCPEERNFSKHEVSSDVDASIQDTVCSIKAGNVAWRTKPSSDARKYLGNNILSSDVPSEPYRERHIFLSKTDMEAHKCFGKGHTGSSESVFSLHRASIAATCISIACQVLPHKPAGVDESRTWHDLIHCEYRNTM